MYMYMLTINSALVTLSSSSLTVAFYGSPQQPSVTPVTQSPGVEHGQQKIVAVSQPNSSTPIYIDTHTTTSPVTTLSVVQCLTTSSSVVTSIREQGTSSGIGTMSTGAYTSLILLYKSPVNSTSHTYIIHAQT